MSNRLPRLREDNDRFVIAGRVTGANVVRRLTLCRRRLGIVGAFAIVALSAGCGIPIESSPRALPSSELSPALAAIPGVPTSSSVPVGDHGFALVPVYFLFADATALKQVETEVPQPPGDTPQAVLRALENGPSAKQYSLGFSTALPQNADFRVIGGPVHGILRVALDPSYYQLPQTLAIQELAQVVYTLSRAPSDVKGVQFYSNGAKAGVPAGNDRFIPPGTPVSRRTYASLFTATD